jgi:pimeloyl-ACP methyl ester carboxylesterase
LGRLIKSGDFERRAREMATIKTKGGTTIYFKDWGKGQAVVFSHGWPLSADPWGAEILLVRFGHARHARANTLLGRQQYPPSARVAFATQTRIFGTQ